MEKTATQKLIEVLALLNEAHANTDKNLLATARGQIAEATELVSSLTLADLTN